MSEGAVADRLDAYIDALLSQQLQACAGREQEALIELVRSADLHAYFKYFFEPPELTTKLANECLFVGFGIGPALRAFLPKVAGLGDGIPWYPSPKKIANWADGFLVRLGQLAMLRRLAHCERYGLVRCESYSDDHVSIHVTGSDVEALDREDLQWMASHALSRQIEQQDLLAQQIKGWARDRIDQYVGIDREHFICYDSDHELLALYQERAKMMMVTSAEADAFPDEVQIGPRSFGEWKGIALNAAARAGLHLSFATRLRAQNRDKLDLRNLLTVFVRYEDLRAVWSEQTGVTDEAGLDEIADVFMLTAKHADEYFTNYDHPLPYQIWFGDHFALLPQFGYLGNVTTFLVTELRRKYRRDWDKAVNEREGKFVQNVFELLPEPDYARGRENVVIRKAGGGTDTDIDAVLFDRGGNCLYLLQVKWFDIFAYGLRERESKLKNLLKANKWVDQVHRWTVNTPLAEILLRVGLQDVVTAPDSMEIRLLVLTRNSARFSGMHQYDDRAGWISWPRLCRLLDESSGQALPLDAVWRTVKETSELWHQPPGEITEYRFPSLNVDLHH
jgi:hypothetical protein